MNGFIHFAIAHNATIESREKSPQHVAVRFGGLPETTELVGVRDFGRLYRMQRSPKKASA